MALSLYCSSTRHTRNSFGPLPQGYCERKKTLNLIKTTSSVLSVLFSIYVYNHKLFCCYYRCTGEMIPNHGSVSWRRKVSTIVINALLTSLFLYTCILSTLLLSNSILSTKPWKVQVCIYPHTKLQTLSPLSNNGIGLSMYLSTHKAIRLYTLYRAMVNRVYIQLTMFRYKSKDKD